MFLYLLLLAAVLFVAFLVLKINVRVAFLAAILLISGGLYYLFDDYRYHIALSKVPANGKIEGIIIEEPKHTMGIQSFYIKTQIGRMLVSTNNSSDYFYGDVVIIEGKIEAPSSNYYGQHIVGVLRNPAINKISSGGGNKILAFLFNIKNSIRNSYRQLLSPTEASLLSGIVFGTNDDFSKQFSNSLSTSGLRFITAIDGLHMQIVILILFGALSYFLARRYAFIFTFLFACFFIALTGFTISGIRAILMAFIAGFAKESGRLYAPHTALASAALVLTLINPKVLVFDIGFQLSFLAVLSIIYFMPVLRRLLHMSNEVGFLNWKESLFIAISVQLATAPIIITKFQTFSLVSFLASVFVVWLLPFIMVLGFLLTIFYFLFYPLALLSSFVVALLVEYVMFIVNLFARLAILFNPSLGFVGVAIYYSILIFLIYKFYQPDSNNKISAD